LSQLVGSRVIGTHGDANSPAVRAGLKTNDVIVQFNGVTIEDDRHLRGLVKLTEVGKRVDVLLYRDGKPLRTTVEIGNFADFAPK
jgi:serine protease Do